LTRRALASFVRAVSYPPVSRRTLLYVGFALCVLLVGRFLSTRGGSLSPALAPETPSATGSASAPPRDPPLRRPANATAELGVLTDRSEAELAPLLDRAALAESLTAAICGEPAACDAVRATLRDEHATTLRVVDASSWDLAHDGTSPASPERGRILGDLDASARRLSAAERARVAHAPRVAVVHVATPASPQALAVRTAFAATAALALATGGAVWDQLLSRIESAREFAKHAPTEPLSASVFRADRVQVLYEPETRDDLGPDAAGGRARGAVVRVLTAGLARWGAPDVEWRAVPRAASERAGRIALRVAQAVAGGLEQGPIVVPRAEVAPETPADGTSPALPERGQMVNDDAGDAATLPDSVAIRILPANPENDDPNDFFARIVPPGEGVVGSLELVERFFGAFAATAPDPETALTEARTAQTSLGATLATWATSRAHGARLLVRLPFPIPGSTGVESMWVDVSSYDATTVTGTLVDDPLGATDLARGERVTRPRADVERVELRAHADAEAP
jgi:hypothetical protein